MGIKGTRAEADIEQSDPERRDSLRTGRTLNPYETEEMQKMTSKLAEDARNESMDATGQVNPDAASEKASNKLYDVMFAGGGMQSLPYGVKKK